MDDDLAALSRIRLEYYYPRALSCARRIIDHFDEIDEVKSTSLITRNVIFERTKLALEIAAAIYKAAPLIPLDVSRKILRSLVQEVFPIFREDLDELSADSHILLTDWLVLAMLAPIPYELPILTSISSYALEMDNRIGAVRAGRLIGALIARDGTARQSLLDQIPDRLLLSVLAKVAIEKVSLPTNLLDRVLEDSDRMSSIEPDEEKLLLVAMRNSAKYAKQIQHHGEMSLSPRVAVEAGSSLYHSLQNEGLAMTHLLNSLKSLQSARSQNLSQWHLMMFAFLKELVSHESIRSLNEEQWKIFKQFLLTGLEHENFVNKARSTAIYQQILSCIWTMLKSRMIPTEDLPEFLVHLLRLALWHHEGLTRHRSNSVLQEAIGRYGLHSACDLIPNLESVEQVDDEEEEEFQSSFGAILAKRYLPIVNHSPLGFEGSVIGAVQTLLAHDHPAYFRHCSTVHHLLENCKRDYIDSSTYIDSVLYQILSDGNIDALLEPNKWQHTRFLALIVSLITVAGYRPHPKIADGLSSLAIALGLKWKRIRITSCVPTKGNMDIHCHHSALASFSLRFWCTIARMNLCFEENPELVKIISSTLCQHACTGGKLAHSEWLRVCGGNCRQSDTPAVLTMAQKYPAMRLMEVLPMVLADCTSDPEIFRRCSSQLKTFFFEQRIRLLQNCIPICVAVIYLDLCGTACSEAPDIFRDLFDLAISQALEHPEPAVRALGREWRTYIDSPENFAQEEVTLFDRVYWRLRDRRIGLPRQQIRWSDLYGDVETIRMRPFTSPTFFYSASLSALDSKIISFNLLGTSNCIAQSKAIARHWGRQDRVDLFDSFTKCKGPWDKNGCFYAAVLRLLRQPSAVLVHKEPTPADVNSVKIACRDDLMILLSTEMNPPVCSNPTIFELSNKVAELCISLGIVE